MAEPMTKEEFVDMLTTMSTHRSKSGYVMAAYEPEDVGNDDPKVWASLLCVINGKLYVDDSDEEPLRENGCVSTRMYGLHEIDDWPGDLFERLSSYTWWIDDEDKIPLLDVLASTPKGENQV